VPFFCGRKKRLYIGVIITLKTINLFNKEEKTMLGKITAKMKEVIDKGKAEVKSLCSGFAKMFDENGKTCKDCKIASLPEYNACKVAHDTCYTMLSFTKGESRNRSTSDVVPEFCKLALKAGKVDKKSFTAELKKLFTFQDSTINHISCDLTILFKVMQDTGYTFTFTAPAPASTPASTPVSTPASTPAATRRRPAAAV
jgi:hypothetical protein